MNKDESPMYKTLQFQRDLARLINQYSLENGSNTPDVILSTFLCNALISFDATLMERQNWYQMESNPGALAQLAYTAYGDHAEWKAWNGLPMPKWDDLTTVVRDHWQAATQALWLLFQQGR